jgi:integrase
MKTPTRPRKGRPSTIKTPHGEVTIYSTGDQFTLGWYIAGERKREKRGDFAGAVTRAGEILDSMKDGTGHVRALTVKQSAVIDTSIDLLREINVPLSSAVREFVEAHKLLDGRVTVLEACRAFIKERGNLDLTPIKFSALVDLFNERNEKQGLSESYRLATAKFLKRAADSLGSKNVADIRAQEIQAVIEKKVSGGPRAYNNLLNAVSACLSFARKQGYLPRDKKHEADLVERKDAKAHEVISVYSPQELHDLLTGIRSDLVPFVALAGLAGIRTAEIFRMTWEMVDFKKGFIILDKAFTKTKRRRIIPISTSLKSWLKPHVGEGRIYGQCAEIRNLEWLLREHWPKAVDRRRNALRHSYGTYRFALLQDEMKVSAEMGNSPRELREHYAELSTPKEATTWFSISRKEAKNILEMEVAA